MTYNSNFDHHQNPGLNLDFYQLTTASAHFHHNSHETRTAWTYYFRKSPFRPNSFAVAGGLGPLIEYINNLHFPKHQIDFLHRLKRFSPAFLEYLAEFKFKGDLYALPEGTLTGAEARGVVLECTALEGHLIESQLLNTMNSNTLWTTLAVLLKHASNGDSVWEGGLRRAQGIDASVMSARAGYLGGMSGTSNVQAAYKYDIPVIGTFPHAWVQFWEDELEAFIRYGEAHPDYTTFLLDTYDTLQSGVPNAIRANKWMQKNLGKQAKGGRLDSGDLAYLSNEAKELFDIHGCNHMTLTASDSLDEHLISSIKHEGCSIDHWLVGTNFVTSKSQPALNGVFKLAAVQLPNGEWTDRIKLSDNAEKTSLPGRQKYFKVIDNETNKHLSDYMCMHDEVIDTSKPMELVHPVYKHKKKVVTNYRVEEALVPIFVNGKQVYQEPTLQEIRLYIQEQKSLLWPQQLRLNNPSPFYVNISNKLLARRDAAIEKARTNAASGMCKYTKEDLELI